MTNSNNQEEATCRWGARETRGSCGFVGIRSCIPGTLSQASSQKDGCIFAECPHRDSGRAMIFTKFKS